MVDACDCTASLVSENRADYKESHDSAAPGLGIGFGKLRADGDSVASLNRFDEFDIHPGREPRAMIGEVLENVFERAETCNEAGWRDRWILFSLGQDCVGISHQAAKPRDHF